MLIQVLSAQQAADYATKNTMYGNARQKGYRYYLKDIYGDVLTSGSGGQAPILQELRAAPGAGTVKVPHY